MTCKTIGCIIASFLPVFLYAPADCVLAADLHRASVEQKGDVIVVHNAVRNSDETMNISVCGQGVIHVVVGPGSEITPSKHTPWIVEDCKSSPFKLEQSEKAVTLKTSLIEVAISLADAHLSYRSTAGTALLNEAGGHPRDYTPLVINGDHGYEVNDRFDPDETEGIYGLGQHQAGVFNYRGSDVELAQENTDVAVPLLISTNGYGIMWNTASRTEFDNRFQRSMKISAKLADVIDYYFLYGPEVDQIIHEYRNLTGHAPLFGEWAYGFVQSKDRYVSAQQLLDIGMEYRNQHVPLDLIVQDWFWWKRQGDPEYTDDYLKPNPDVSKVLRTLHDEHLHSVISVWPVLNRQSSTYNALNEEKGIIGGTNLYDPTNPVARDLYWKLLPGTLVTQGWDGFWLDASEPEMTLDNKQLFIGDGARYSNIFPLMHTGNIYEHWRNASLQKRAFILTRSAFLGQQRNAAVTWSGDIYGTFTDLSRQIPAGLNFAVSGIPYWTSDIGGYTSPYDMKDATYRELYVRWYEFGAFCPIFRTHGHRAENEVFSYDSATPILIEYDKLRYRLMPYIYSLAWRVTNEDYTMQRPLIMDWRTVDKVRDIGDQFMFGPSILVSPVTFSGATTRGLYLPPSTGWFDFWTGKRLSGDQSIEASAPLNRIPLYVRAGSILPLGPEIQYATERSDSPITLRVYTGADAKFDLYEDDGSSYNYEHGEQAIIPISWDEATQTLIIGERVGAFPGMPNKRTFRIVWVANGHGAGDSLKEAADKVISYDGKNVVIKKPSRVSLAQRHK